MRMNGLITKNKKQRNLKSHTLWLFLFAPKKQPYYIQETMFAKKNANGIFCNIYVRKILWQHILKL